MAGLGPVAITKQDVGSLDWIGDDESGEQKVGLRATEGRMWTRLMNGGSRRVKKTWGKLPSVVFVAWIPGWEGDANRPRTTVKEPK